MDVFVRISPEQIRARREQILAVASRYTCTSVALDEEKGELRLRFSDHVPACSANELCFALRGVGVSAVPAGGPVASPRRSVRLSVFLVSLAAAALVAAFLTFSLSALLFGGFSSSRDTLGTSSQSGENYAGKIGLIDRIFREYSLYDTDGQLLLDEMLKAYAAATGDAYAAYYTDEEYARLLEENNASLVGIGITAVENAEAGAIEVISVMPASPALEAGLLPGDRIIAIGTDDARTAVSALGYEAAVAALRGEEGSIAAFVVERDGREIAYRIPRAKVETISAEGWVSASDPTVGILRITQFDTHTPAQFSSEMDRLLAAGCVKFVYDVRNNPGGDLKSIMAVLSFFLQENDTMLSTVEKDGTTTYYRVESVVYTDDYAGCSVKKSDIGKYRGYAAVVLVNGNTASAAELFTAALSDYGLAVVVGTTTYGKGIIQSTYSLQSWGYGGAVKLTVGYYNPPSGQNYDGKGIAPQVEVQPGASMENRNLYTLSEAEDNQLQAAISQVNHSSNT